jgi:hypothetical protein
VTQASAEIRIYSVDFVEGNRLMPRLDPATMVAETKSRFKQHN